MVALHGTFSAAKTALSMDLPLFVLNPNCLDNPPKGNEALIELGGYSLDPANGAEVIVECISGKTEEAAPVANQNSPAQLLMPFVTSAPS